MLTELLLNDLTWILSWSFWNKYQCIKSGWILQSIGGVFLNKFARVWEI